MERQKRLVDFLDYQSQQYNGTVDPQTLQQLDTLLRAHFGGLPYYLNTLLAIIGAFSFSPCPALLINMSAMGLYFIVRRQRRESVGVTSGYSNSGAEARTKALKSVEHQFLVVSLRSHPNSANRRAYQNSALGARDSKVSADPPWMRRTPSQSPSTASVS